MSVKLFHGDCIKVLDMFSNACVDQVICDPPYNINYSDWDSDFDFQVIAEKLSRIVKKDSNIIIFQGWSNVCETKSIFDKYFTLKDWIIYDRVKGRGGKRSLVSTREDILWYVNGNNYVFNKVSSNIKKVTGGMGKKNGNEYRSLTNVWSDLSPIVPWSQEKTEHPTQKSIQLMERCVSIWSNPGDLVLDFTMGSGTTGIACKNLNRHFVGIEKDEKYFDIAKKRIEYSDLV